MRSTMEAKLTALDTTTVEVVVARLLDGLACG
jgi:hypothetical protein